MGRERGVLIELAGALVVDQTELVFSEIVDGEPGFGVGGG